MTRPAPGALPTSSQRARSAIVAAIVIGAASALATASGLLVLPPNPTWPQLASNVLPGLMVVLAIVSLWFSRRGWVTPAVVVLLGGLLANLLGTALFSSGLGVVIGALALILPTGIAALTLPPRLVGRTVMVSVIVGAAALLYDLYGPADRPAPSELAGVIYAAAGVMLLFFSTTIFFQLRNYSLRAKLITAFVGVTVLAVSAVSFATNLITRSELTKSLAANVGSVAEVQAQSAGAVLGRYVNLLNLLAVNKTVQDRVLAANAAYVGGPATIQSRLDGLDQQWRGADAAGNNNDTLVQSVLINALSAELREFSITFPDNAEVFITDTHGANVAATNRTSDYYQADEAWWQAAYQNGLGSTFIGQPEFDESASVYAAVMAVPVYSPERHEVIGVVRSTLRLSALQAVLGAKLRTAGHSELILPDGTIFTAEGKLDQLEPAVFAQVTDPTSPELLEVNLHGETRLIAQARVIAQDRSAEVPVGSLGWRVLVVVEPQEVYAPITTATRTAVLVSLGALVAATFLAMLVAQLLSGPIVRLTAAAEQVRGGNLAAQAPVEGQDEIGALAATFNTMTAQLRDVLQGLEQRVADRTQALAASAEVSRRLSTILDQKQLVAEVVEQVQTAFNYYHAHIYLFDESGENLVMAGGTGTAGATMLARGHKLPHGRGLVGRAAETRAPVLVPDVTQDPNWLPNPLLPDTKSEVAVPIAAGGRVLGVLDVQQDVVNGLSEDDVSLLRSIANQVAVALQNARLYTDAQRQADRQSLLNTITQRIRNASTLEGVLQVAARELGTALNARRAAVQLNLDNGHGDEHE